MRDTTLDEANDNSSASQFFKTYEETKNWLDEMAVRLYEIDENSLSVDVRGPVNLSKKNLTKIPVRFGKVNGEFNVSDNPKLESLAGSPAKAVCIMCDSTNIKNFDWLGDINFVYAKNIKSLESFKGLPTRLTSLNIQHSCENVHSFDHFPTTVSGYLSISHDFRFTDILHKHSNDIGNIVLCGSGKSYGCILYFLHINGIKNIIFSHNRMVSDILNKEISCRPNPKKRNLLRIAHELSNAGFHNLTVV